MNSLIPLMPGDDYLYSLKIPAHHHIGQDVIDSFSDYFESIYNHYYNYNYRVFPHALLQLILLLPGLIFDILNTLVFFLMPWVVIRGAGHRYSLQLYMFLILFTWVFHFDLGRSYFWTTGSLNYSWMLLLQLLFLSKLLERLGKEAPSGPWLILLALLVCTTNENMVLSFFLASASLFLYKLVKYKSRDNILIGTACILLIGGLLMLNSPALDIRLEKEGYRFDNAAMKIAEYLKRTGYYMVRFIPACGIIFILAPQKISWNRQATMIGMIVILSMVSMFSAPLFEPRSAIFGFYACMMGALVVSKGGQVVTWAWGVMGLLALFVSIQRTPAFFVVNELYEANRQTLEAEQGSSDTVYLKRFCRAYKMDALICDDISDDPNYMDNEPLAAYYNIHKISLQKEYSLLRGKERFIERMENDARMKTKEIGDLSLWHDIKADEIRYMKLSNGLSIALHTAMDTAIGRDLTLVVRGSRKGISTHLFTRLLPHKLQLYFLDFLDYPEGKFVHDGKVFFYTHLFDPDTYEYLLLSLYERNNHRPVGEVIRLDLRSLEDFNNDKRTSQ